MSTEDTHRAPGFIRRWLDDIPLGLAPLLIAGMALVAGAYLLVHPVHRPRADLTMWVFGPLHADAYQAAAQSFAARTGHAVDVQLVNFNAVNQKLRSALWAAVNIPDLVEIEKSAAGGFFRGPLDQVGFLDLKPYLQRDGILARIPANALATYTDRGAIFGIPHDIHPVMLAPPWPGGARRWPSWPPGTTISANWAACSFRSSATSCRSSTATPSPSRSS